MAFQKERREIQVKLVVPFVVGDWFASTLRPTFLIC